MMGTSVATKPSNPTTKHAKPIRTLAVDIGASGLKVAVLNEQGEPVMERQRIKTPNSGKPAVVLDLVVSLAKKHGGFDRVSVGFPGVVRDGIVCNAPNFAEEWKDFNLAKVLSAQLRKPVRVANDADVQGYGAISGVGVELVLTLGTGVGSSLFVRGSLVPNLEVGRSKLSDAELQRVGKKKWNKRVAKVVAKLERMFHYDRLYIGGGNAQHVDVSTLPANVTIVSNLNGLVGGIALWGRG
jgi:polyphosphate glucokinase